VLFFFSGASSLIFEAIFTRLLTYTFGNTAYAVSTVLAAFLGGLALGAVAIGRWADRRPPSLRIYGALELLVALYCFFIPQLFAILTGSYIALYHYFELSPSVLTATRFGLAALVILVPTTLMGGTLPVLAGAIASGASGPRDFAPEINRLYAWNTLGAALGTLVATTLFMPVFGVRETIWIACGTNLAIFLSVRALPTKPAFNSGPDKGLCLVPISDAETTGETPRLLLLTGFLIGAVALGYEVTWTHVLSFLIGNTVYAFGVMLFTFLCGLGWGSQIVSRYFRRAKLWSRALAGSQIFLGLAVFLTLPLWNRIPDLFAVGLKNGLEYSIQGAMVLLAFRMAIVGTRLYRRPVGSRLSWPGIVELGFEVLLLAAVIKFNTPAIWKFETTYFVAGELLRFFSSFYLLIVPAILLGMSFPLLLNLASRRRGHVGGSVGGIYAANTVGAIFGSLFMGFAVLPRLGSFAAMRAAATVNLALGLGIALFWVRLKLARKFVLALAISSLAIIFWAGQGGWDARAISRGSYVYFNKGWDIDRVLYMAEDVQAGLTSVVQMGSSHVLLSNGKFQGSNTGEAPAQVSFALMPMLFTRSFDRALVIGLGTGQTLHTIASFPFSHIDAVEIAPRIIDAARTWFEDVNGRIFDHDPRIKLSVADGRNFLMLSRQRYDLITIEITSIWISGEADLYNREFYELCRQRLKDGGVLQQWVQIHHMRTMDLLVVLNTAAQVFPNVALFLGAGQGVMIASASPLECDYRQMETFDADPKVRGELAAVGAPSAASLLGDLMLFGGSTRRAVAYLPQGDYRSSKYISTDFHPYLEYQTPRGNSIPYDMNPVNIGFMEKLRSLPLPPDLEIHNLPSENERCLVLGYVLEREGNARAALESFEKVRGPARRRAMEEIGRIGANQGMGNHLIP
jgi:spermidine synthase